MSLGVSCIVAQAASGIEVARVWFGRLCGTCEAVALEERVVAGGYSLWRSGGPLLGPGGKLRVAETIRSVYRLWGAVADRLVVALKLGNAGGVKGAGGLGLLVGQPLFGGMSS